MSWQDIIKTSVAQRVKDSKDLSALSIVVYEEKIMDYRQYWVGVYAIEESLTQVERSEDMKDKVRYVEEALEKINMFSEKEGLRDKILQLLSEEIEQKLPDVWVNVKKQIQEELQ